MIERKIYECEHCNKKRLMNPYQMKYHEKICWYNPKNKTCVTCWHSGRCVKSCDLGIERVDYPKPNINCKHWKDYDEELERLCEEV